MPNKRIDNLKDEGMRSSGQEWQRDIGVNNMTTNEWDYAVDRAMSGASNQQIKSEILRNRK